MSDAASSKEPNIKSVGCSTARRQCSLDLPPINCEGAVQTTKPDNYISMFRFTNYSLEILLHEPSAAVVINWFLVAFGPFCLDAINSQGMVSHSFD